MLSTLASILALLTKVMPMLNSWGEKLFVLWQEERAKRQADAIAAAKAANDAAVRPASELIAAQLAKEAADRPAAPKQP